MCQQGGIPKDALQIIQSNTGVVAYSVRNIRASVSHNEKPGPRLRNPAPRVEREYVTGILEFVELPYDGREILSFMR